MIHCCVNHEPGKSMFFFSQFSRDRLDALGGCGALGQMKMASERERTAQKRARAARA